MPKVKPSNLDKYTGDVSDNDPLLTKIVVPSEWAKQQLLAASQYLHDLREIDTDYKAVNLITHLYSAPSLIEVQ